MRYVPVTCELCTKDTYSWENDDSRFLEDVLLRTLEFNKTANSKKLFLQREKSRLERNLGTLRGVPYFEFDGTSMSYDRL